MFKFPIDSKGYVNFSMMLIAKRRSGKTELIRYLYENYLEKSFDLVVVYSTMPTSSYYKKFISGKKVFITNNDLTKIEKIIKKNGDLMKKGKKIINTLVIFDDTNTNKQKFDERVLDLYTKGRHFNTSIIYSSQAPTLVNNIWKENSDFIIIFKMKTRRYKDYVIENILSGMIDINFKTRSAEKKFYEDLFIKCVEDQYSAMVLDLTDDKVFAFKAPL